MKIHGFTTGRWSSNKPHYSTPPQSKRAASETQGMCGDCIGRSEETVVGSYRCPLCGTPWYGPEPDNRRREAVAATKAKTVFSEIFPEAK